jgi:KDO2-lipid IV(A) lauroyltransferase
VDILREHYRELGRIAAEYARMPELVRALPGEVVAEVRGEEHLETALSGGRGAILLTGHYGNFELLGAWLGRRHPVDFVVKPLNNPHTERWILRQRERSGVGTLRSDLHVRRVYEALRANRWVAMLADQDARRAGIFVPFMGRPASTATGPARIALATGAPIVMGFAVRGADGRHVLEIDPPYFAEGRGDAAVERVTAWHTARLEAWVRRHPYNWFWLHRRWKTIPRPSAPA